MSDNQDDLEMRLQHKQEQLRRALADLARKKAEAAEAKAEYLEDWMEKYEDDWQGDPQKGWDDWPPLKEAQERVAELEAALQAEELYSQPTVPAELVELVNLASAELIKFLKTHPRELDKLRSRQFEELIAELLASCKWDVKLTPATRDGGYDIFAIVKDISGVQQSWIIECKKYREDRKVGVDIVRQLFSVKDDLRVGNALLATTSHFTAGVEEYKDSRYDLELKDREGILRWIDEYHPKKGGLYLRDSGLKLPGKDGFRHLAVILSFL